MISIFIIENDNMSRIGATAILSENQKFQVCGAKYGKEGLDIIASQKPDVVVINIDLPDMCGIEAISAIKHIHESARIVVMTANSDRDSIKAAIANGADCYYCKNNPKEEVGERFLEAIFAAYNNESWIDPTINRILIDSFRSKETEEKQISLLSEFSDKELTALKLVASGMKNDEVANVMYVSEGTVRSYLHNSFIKLGVNDRLNAIREGIRLGILTFADMKIEQEATYRSRKTRSSKNDQKNQNRQAQKDQDKSYQSYRGWAA
ncbi:response regulator [Scytonema hofmannii]|nr:response regulator transcription factor [Scytonema hofmannii]